MSETKLTGNVQHVDTSDHSHGTMWKAYRKIMDRLFKEQTNKLNLKYDPLAVDEGGTPLDEDVGVPHRPNPIQYSPRYLATRIITDKMFNPLAPRTSYPVPTKWFALEVLKFFSHEDLMERGDFDLYVPQDAKERQALWDAWMRFDPLKQDEDYYIPRNQPGAQLLRPSPRDLEEMPPLSAQQLEDIAYFRSKLFSALDKKRSIVCPPTKEVT